MESQEFGIFSLLSCMPNKKKGGNSVSDGGMENSLMVFKPARFAIGAWLIV